MCHNGQMRYETVEALKDADFKRSTGVQRGTVENILIKSKQFHLPGKKALQPSDTVIEIVLVDATEQPIERPKKDNAGIIAAKRSVTRRKRS
ncbi:MAG: hypothetical protein Fur002_22240 [Anaerolineales bacterium]